jgi:hypothetical protein
MRRVHREGSRVQEGHVVGFLVNEDLVHTVGGHSDATGCVRWHNITDCGDVPTRARYIQNVFFGTNTVTCIACVIAKRMCL